MTKKRMAIGTLCAIGVGSAIAAKKRSSDKREFTFPIIGKKLNIGPSH
jgi:hypothetical protein